MKLFKLTRIQIEFLRIGRKSPRELLTKKFNRRFRKNYTRIQINAICKRKGFYTERTGRFPKGHKSWNKGTKGLTSANSGSFKKGDRPANWKPVGSERYIEKDDCLMIKVAEPNVWLIKARVLWEKKNGKIKKGMILRLTNGNGRKCILKNIKPISRALHMRLNQMHYKETQKKYKPTIWLLAELTNKIGENK